MFLKSDGALYFEIHEAYGVQLKTELDVLGFKDIELRKDLQGKDRMLKAVKR